MSLAVIIPVYNSAAMLAVALQAIKEGTRQPDELWVVDDASNDNSAATARAFGAGVLTMERNVGPAACRNSAALLTKSSILIFLDADTWVHLDTIERLEAHLLEDSTLSAVIGAYDDAPYEPGLISRHRNLAHCYVHRSAQKRASTFWSGCGAIDRGAFLRAGGFDERYRRPSVEDIELGYRLSGKGERIRLDSSIVVKHAKRWTIANAVTTDVRDRGIPWVLLLLEMSSAPNDLNISTRNRASTAMVGAALIFIGCSFYSSVWLAVSLVLMMSAIALHHAMFRFIESRGVRPRLFSWGLFLLGEICNLAAMLGGVTLSMFGARSGDRVSRIDQHGLEIVQPIEALKLSAAQGTPGSSRHSAAGHDRG